MGKWELRGQEVVGVCRNCKQEFTYTYNRKTRISCDVCKAYADLSRPRRKHYAESNKKTEAQRLAMHPDHAIGMRRDLIMTKHDLQHSAPENFARFVNAILQGERGLV